VVGFTTGSRGEVPGKRKPVMSAQQQQQQQQQQHNNNNNNNNRNRNNNHIRLNTINQ
jgi:hypothetical protein